jgi:TRAP-type mannitol/chloroaromatic compound transport system substrate-binding protein
MSANEAFGTIYKAQKDFRDKNYLYHQYADFQYDAVMLQLRRKT